jgi:hypothetical protein
MLLSAVVGSKDGVRSSVSSLGVFHLDTIPNEWSLYCLHGYVRLRYHVTKVGVSMKAVQVPNQMTRLANTVGLILGLAPSEVVGLLDKSPGSTLRSNVLKYLVETHHGLHRKILLTTSVTPFT